MISVSQLTKLYGQQLAVDHISFEVGKGQIVGFLGPNGASKSTTLRMLTCFLPPTSGGRPSMITISFISRNRSDRTSAISRKMCRCMWKCGSRNISTSAADFAG